jgi:NTE family protein
MTQKTRVGLAFQGGGFPAGALGAGVVKRLVEDRAFDEFDIDVFSGTSAGALVASVCWGHKLKGTISEAPETLERLWMHFAWGLVPNAKVAQASQLVGAIAQMNPVQQYVSENMIVPLLRHMMKDWILTYIPIDELIEVRDKAAHVPGLALGSAEVLEGEIKVFTERDFCLDAVMASGSLDEVNGITVIKEGPNSGVYCDGAWGTNPPIAPMMEYGVDQVWFVEVFPQKREQIPANPGERKDRKDELWQNSLVQHELEDIERVNRWLEVDPNLKKSRLNNDDGRYRHIVVKKLPMTLDLPAGSALVNARGFLQKMMDYGYEHAPILMAK